MLPFEHLLVPTDFSPPAAAALDAAVELAAHFGARVTLTHVITPGAQLEQGGQIEDTGPAFHADAVRQAVQSRLDGLVTELRSHGLDGRGVLRHGEAGHEIVQLAALEAASCIVIATHGRAGWRHLAFGSVTEQVVRTASCPVLTIRVAPDADSPAFLLALFDDLRATGSAARALRDAGLAETDLSVMTRTPEDDRRAARAVGATAGVEAEPSAAVQWLGDVGAHVAAAIALVLPGIGPIVAAGPLAAELEATARREAGDLPSFLIARGMSQPRVADWQQRVHAGAVLLGAHVPHASMAHVRRVLEEAGARDVDLLDRT